MQPFAGCLVRRLAMPRTYIRKTAAINEDGMKKAIVDVEQNSSSVRAAAKAHGVDRATLQRRLAKLQTGSVGRARALTDEEEQYIVLALKYCSDLGWAFSRDKLMDFVEQYVTTKGLKTPFKNGRPGQDWCISFLNRHKAELALRKPETVTIGRAKGLNRQVLNTFFDMLEQQFTQWGVKDQPTRIFNLDETGLNTDPKLHQLIFKRGTKDAQAILPTEGKTMFSVLFCGNAAGQYLPPYVVYKSKHLNANWIIGGPPGTMYNCTKSGWMEDYVFEEWLVNGFLPYVDNVPKPVVLIFDGHGSHLTAASATAAREANVQIICLPPHTSGALQPLDVAVFKPMKGKWRDILKNFFRESDLTTVKKEHFPILLKEVVSYMKQHPGHLSNGFAKSGICPLNREAIPEAKVMLSEVTESTEPVSVTIQQSESTSSASQMSPTTSPVMASQIPAQ